MKKITMAMLAAALAAGSVFAQSENAGSATAPSDNASETAKENAEKRAERKAQRAKEKAEARAKKAWKKAMTISKKKLRALNRKRR